MTGSRAAIRYAKAILSLSLELKKADQVNDDMLLVSSTIEDNQDLQILLNSPVIKTDAKRSTLSAIFDKKTNKLSQNLINLLIDNKRLPLLSEVAKQYTILFDQQKGIQVAEVTTAVTLTKSLEEKVLAKVKELTGKNATLENIIDPEIIGGFILRVGDKQFDASILGKMNNLRREFENNLHVSKL